MTDTIFLRDLRIRTIVGVWDWEQRMPQTVSVDLDMAADIARAACSDALGDTLDYKAVAARIREFVETSRFQLVETMAERIAGIVTKEFGVPWVRVAVHKPYAIRDARDVGVVIERGRRE